MRRRRLSRADCATRYVRKILYDSASMTRGSQRKRTLRFAMMRFLQRPRSENVRAYSIPYRRTHVSRTYQFLSFSDSPSFAFAEAAAAGAGSSCSLSVPELSGFFLLRPPLSSASAAGFLGSSLAAASQVDMVRSTAGSKFVLSFCAVRPRARDVVAHVLLPKTVLSDLVRHYSSRFP